MTQKIKQRLTEINNVAFENLKHKAFALLAEHIIFQCSSQKN